MTNPTNNNPFEPWNGFYADSHFAPWNDPMKADNPFACWNNAFGKGAYEDESREYNNQSQFDMR